MPSHARAPRARACLFLEAFDPKFHAVDVTRRVNTSLTPPRGRRGFRRK